MDSSNRPVVDLGVVIPVLHEEENIGRVLANVLDEQTALPAGVVVVDGDDAGSTLAAVDRPEPELVRGVRGRAKQMNAGAANLSAGGLLFLHADTVLPPNGLALAAASLDDPSVTAGAFRLEIDSSDPVIRWIGRVANRRVARNRIPFGDQAIFVKEDYFRSVGGFPDIPIMEDLEFMRRIPHRSSRVRLLDRAVLTSGRRWEEEGPLRCSARNIALRALYRLGVGPERLARWYF